MTPFDERCWGLARFGQTPDQIAILLQSSPAQVQNGIAKMQAWMAAGSHDVVNTIINHQVINAAGDLGRVLRAAMRAERVIAPPVRDPNTGQELAPMVTVPDHETRLEAVKQTGTLAAAIRDKGGNINVGVAVGMPGGAGAGGGPVKSFEQRVRELREKNGLRNSSDELPVIDAEIVEADDGGDDDGSDGDNSTNADAGADTGTDNADDESESESESEPEDGG